MSETETTARRIGRYEILRPLGRGGMAGVYLARHRDLDRLVALKELAAFGVQDPQMVHRFLREAQIAGSLTAPNIVTVHEAFATDGVPYIAMEYLARGSLRPLVGSLNLAQSFAVIEDVLTGLETAERQNVVHRDLKPENLLVTDDGHVKIADFGIAKAVDRAVTTEFKTATGMTVGTPSYMAPEQALGKPLTKATDLYSVGVIAYELMVGRLPFESESPVALLLLHVSEAPPPPLSVRPDLDPELAAWIERLMHKEPAERTPTAAQARDELEEIAIRLLGPRWRRGAALPAPRPAREAAPAPPSDSVSELFPDQPTPPPEEVAAPREPVAAPTVHEPAPPPVHAPAPPPPRRRMSSPAWIATLVAIAAAAAVVAFLVRPSGDSPPPPPTPAPDPGTTRPLSYGTGVYSVQLPAGWLLGCREGEGQCAKVPAGLKRAGFAWQTDQHSVNLTIDHVRSGPGITVDFSTQRQDVTLARSVPGYKRAEVSARTISGGRRGQEFSFSSSDPQLKSGTVYVFKERGNVYAVTGQGTDAETVRPAVEMVAAAIHTR